MAQPRFIRFNVSYDGFPRYRGISISTVKETVAEFESGEPMSDWKAMCNFIAENPGAYMSTSSFEEFVWEVPGYQFVLTDAGKERLVPIPEINEKVPNAQA